MESLFERIISGELAGSFVYRDELCVAIMDLYPLNPGHVLVIPRQAVSKLSDLAPNTAEHLFGVAQKILRAIETSGLRCEGANLFLSDGPVAGQDVPHVHLHVVPRFAGDGMRFTFGKRAGEAGRAELDRIAQQIVDKISPGIKKKLMKTKIILYPCAIWLRYVGFEYP